MKALLIQTLLCYNIKSMTQKHLEEGKKMDPYENEKGFIISFLIKLLLSVIVVVAAMAFAFRSDATGSEKIITIVMTLVVCIGFSFFVFIEVRKFIYAVQESQARKKIE